MAAQAKVDCLGCMGCMSRKQQNTKGRQPWTL